MPLLSLVVGLTAAEARAPKSGVNYVNVNSCEQVGLDIKISRGGGAKYVLNSTVRDAGHGLRDYKLTCVNSRRYRVEWREIFTTPPAPAPVTTNISMTDDMFTPKNITVRAGTTIKWVNNGVHPHTVTAEDGTFDSGTINSAGIYSRTFSSAGYYPYYCRFHGAAGGYGMAGVITVIN